VHESEIGLTAAGVAWRLGATLFFVLLNGFFVAAEFALVKIRASRVRELVAEGRSGARTTEHLLANLDRYLSGCQLGITIASLILGALGEPAVSRLLLAMLVAAGYHPDTAPAWLPFVSIGLAFTIITTLHMTLGEQAPKMWALRRAERTALQTALVLRSFTVIFWPFIATINAISNGLLRLAGLPPGSGHEPIHSGDEIRSILALSAHAGHITEREYELTENVFRLIELEVRHIVVPRVDVEYLSLERSAEENLNAIRSSSHSRFPLCERDLDSIVGFVHGKDVLEQLLDDRTPDFPALARPPLFVPETMPLSNFLQEIQTKQVHAAAVIDEHGTVIGLGFREDALEEIVGPLGDEFDESVQPLAEIGPGRYEMSGRMALPDVEGRLDFELSPAEDEDQDTIGGHVTALLHRLPRKGDAVDVGPFRATVLEVSRRRIQRLRLERREEGGEAADSGSAGIPAADGSE
jgi:CBS domain containing-hemolysin-like protein